MLQGVKDWAAKPFSADMDATHWAALTVLVLGVSVGFNIMLRHVTHG